MKTLIKKLNKGEILSDSEMLLIGNIINREPKSVESHQGKVNWVVNPISKEVYHQEELYQDYMTWKIQWAMDAYRFLMDDKENRFRAISGNLMRNSFHQWVYQGEILS